MWNRLFDTPPDWTGVALAAAGTVLIAWILSVLAARVVRAVLVVILGDSLDEGSVTPAIRRPGRIVAGAVFLLTAIALFFPALELVGVRTRAGLPLRTLTDWFFHSGLRIVFVGILAYAVVRMIAVLVRRFEHEISQGTGLDALERAKRAKTLGSLIENVVTALVVTVAILMMLRELRLDIIPLLTGAGIVGIALGFGAQTLVRDIISGFFIILENQVRVGDVVKIDGVGGLVEAINLRTIVLRDAEGAVHIFPAGSIERLTNQTKDFAYALVELTVSYKEDADRVVALVKDVGAALQKDPDWQLYLLGGMEVWSIDAIGDWSFSLKARMKTAPLKQWDVARELRRRIKRTFEEHHIERPARLQEIVLRRVPRTKDER